MSPGPPSLFRVVVSCPRPELGPRTGPLRPTRGPPPMERFKLPHLVAPVCLSAALVGSGFLGACQGPPESRVNEEGLLAFNLEWAQNHYELGDLDRAEKMASDGLDIDPDNLPLKLLFGYIRQQRGGAEDIQVARNVFMDVTQKHPEDFRGWIGLGNSKERFGILQEEAAIAIASGERFTAAVDPDVRASELRDLADQQWVEARTAYERALELSTRNIQAINGLMRVSSLQGDYDASLESADQLLGVLSEEVDFRRGQINLPELTDQDEHRLRKEIRQDTDVMIAVQLHATSTLHRLGRVDDALARLDDVIRMDADIPETYSRRAQLLVEKSRWEEARSSINEFLRRSTLDFDHPDIRRAYDLHTLCDANLRALELLGG